MTIATTDEQRAVQESIRAWARSAEPSVTVRAAETDAQAWRALWPALAELGLFAVALPEDLGGVGATVVDLAAMLEQAATELAPGPVLPTAVAGLALAAAGGGVAEELCPRVAEGALTFGVSSAPEPVQADSAADGARTLNGRTGLVLGADSAGALLLEIADTDGSVWVVLDPAAEGVQVEKVTSVDFGVPLARVELTDVRVSPDRVLTGLRDGLVADLLATLAAAEAAGVAGWCLTTAVEYAKIREQFGKPIGSFQAIKHLCAEMLCRTEQIRAVAWDAAVAAESGDELPIAAAVAASVALDAAVDTAKDCIQVLGGIGFTWEHEAHFYLRRVLSLRQLLGGGAAWRARVAELTRAGARRHLTVDLGDLEAQRETVRAEVEAISALPEAERRVAFAESGYLAPHWPAPYGKSAKAAEQILIGEELVHAELETPNLVIGWWAVPTILEHGTAEQIERFAMPTLRGELVWCQLFSEPGAGSDLASLRTTAEKVDGGWILNGQKVWTSLAREADWAICLARTDKDVPKHKGITYFVVDMQSAGIRISPLREITGDALFNEVFLDGVFVPDECVVGQVNGGWKLARTTLANERVAMSGGSSLGKAMEELLELSGRGGTDPVTEERIGFLIGEALVGSLLEHRTTLRQLDGQDPGPASSVRKLVGVRHRQAVAEFALGCAGAEGAVEGPLSREFLNTRCLSIAGGTEQILLTVAAEHLLGLPRG
ncbi:acyl-CoA dehydrogenase [Rhodococcus sp. D2-41]|uniref:Acyl-CoA dehydrogenase n=1 Tax=Speluncibacter jeojiensis TaxID=2710754 RepID=A0A9X4RG22_9ACTN|nr:acyl-CoA dehydrogenase [Rhodococcus sp. D2-41]MDG3009916.1 acyl-CoA dehydrogenase [Rhodococcus sp. D2-41]MDG3017149.1 acyl-CoA dehydrogenase [Corynebacteriales bacterium D3-21]